MRLRAQLLLSAVGTALLCAVVGTYVVSQYTQKSAESLLERALISGQESVLRQWQLRRSQRKTAYQAAARSAYLRWAVASGDQEQLEALTTIARESGAAVAAVIEPGGKAMAAYGDGAGQLALLASQGLIDGHGEVVALGGELVDAIKVPLGSDPPIGYLVAASPVTTDALRADAQPFHVEVTVAQGGVVVSTLPDGLRPSGRGLDFSQSDDLRKLRSAYRTQLHDFGQARLMTAISVDHYREFTRDFVRQVVALLLVFLGAVAVVVVIVVERITSPIEQLKQAADELGNGQLLRSRALLQPFTQRTDEIGTLAKTIAESAQRLYTVVLACHRLVRHLDGAVMAVERSATAVNSSATRQEQRLDEVSRNLGPMRAIIELDAQALADARSIAITLSLITSAGDQAMTALTTAIRRTESLLTSGEGTDQRNFRTASVLQQTGALVKLQEDQRATWQKIRDQVAILKRGLDTAVEAQPQEVANSLNLTRSADEIARLAKLNVDEAASLRGTGERLRRDIEMLYRLLSSLEVYTSEDPQLERRPPSERSAAVRRPEGANLGDPLAASLSDAMASVRWDDNTTSSGGESSSPPSSRSLGATKRSSRSIPRWAPVDGPLKTPNSSARFKAIEPVVPTPDPNKSRRDS